MKYGTIPSLKFALVLSALVVAHSAAASIPDQNGIFHGCLTKSTGALRIIDTALSTCKSSETAISWSTGGSPAAAGPLMVRDSLNQIVGPWATINVGTDWAIRYFGGQAVDIPVSPAGFLNSGFTFFYANSLCSGPPLMYDPMLTSVAGLVGTTLYYPSGTPISMSGLWQIDFDQNGAAADDCTATFYSVLVAPVATFDLSTLNLVPPFHLSQ